jgi:hypothetical protein
VGQAHAPERRIARKTHGCKLTARGGQRRRITKKSNWAGTWRRRSLPRCHGIGLDYTCKKYANESANIGLLSCVL